MKVLIKHLAIFFLFPSMKFLLMSFKIQLLETSPQKQKEQIQKQQDVSFSDFFSLPVHFELFAIFSYCLYFVCLLVKETAEIETGMAEKSSWDQANIRQKLGLVWRNRKKISQIIEDYFYLPFFLLIILWLGLIRNLPLTLATVAEADVADVAEIVRFDVYGYQNFSGLYIGLTCNL